MVNTMQQKSALQVYSFLSYSHLKIYPPFFKNKGCDGQVNISWYLTRAKYYSEFNEPKIGALSLIVAEL